MTESPKSPLARLILFMVCLSIAGTIVAGAHYYAVDLPQQANLQAPTNADDCGCYYEYTACLAPCRGSGAYAGCGATCYPAYLVCQEGCGRFQ
ncbi:MAG: hypothetical protein M0Q92_06000 [Methanoregula sp.]|jgi:hypothetical protein|nr:hypothetical protein [Methanoregula sp.]